MKYDPLEYWIWRAHNAESALRGLWNATDPFDGLTVAGPNAVAVARRLAQARSAAFAHLAGVGVAAPADSPPRTNAAQTAGIARSPEPAGPRAGGGDAVSFFDGDDFFQSDYWRSAQRNQARAEGRSEASAEVARLRRRVAALEARLARVLDAATWAHNHHAREGFKGVLRPYGNVWSRRHRRTHDE